MLESVRLISVREGYESGSSGATYVLKVEPLTKDKFLYRGRIWVDAEDFAVVRLEAEPAKNPSFWIKNTAVEQVYAKVNDFWLPLVIEVLAPSGWEATPN